MKFESENVDPKDILNPYDFNSARFSKFIIEQIENAIAKGEEVEYRYRFSNGQRLFRIAKVKGALCLVEIENRGRVMNDLVENGKKPDDVNPSYVTCPHCNKTADYWETGMNTFLNQRNIICCLSCGKYFHVIGIGDGCMKLEEK